MANTFKKVYKKIANTGASSDYSLVAEVGLGGNPISSVSTATPGLMPALTGSSGDFLKGDGTWGTIPTASSNTNGLMPSSLVTKLNGIAEGANNYSLPEATSVTRGGILLGGGTNNFLRADGTWATPSASVTSTDSITNGSSALITSGGVYSKLGLSSSENFTVNGTTYATVKAAIAAINTRMESGASISFYEYFYDTTNPIAATTSDTLIIKNQWCRQFDFNPPLSQTMKTGLLIRTIPCNSTSFNNSVDVLSFIPAAMIYGITYASTYLWAQSPIVINHIASGNSNSVGLAWSPTPPSGSCENYLYICENFLRVFFRSYGPDNGVQVGCIIAV